MNFVIDFVVSNPKVCAAFVVGGISLLLIPVLREWEAGEHERAEATRTYVMDDDGWVLSSDDVA